MDLKTDFSASESFEDNQVVNRATAKDNGSCTNEADILSVSGVRDVNVPVDDDFGQKGVQIEERQSSPPLEVKSPPSGVSPSTTKGYGLKKWRRIKRDVVKDAGPSVDISKAGKRGLPGGVNPNTKPLHLSPVDIRQNSEGSVGSTNLLNNVGAVDGFPLMPGSSLDSRMPGSSLDSRMPGSSLDSRVAVGAAFAAGTDSENSEDRSSKSSTAASAPKMKHELPAVMGNARERSRTKNLIAKGGGNPTPRVQQGKNWADSSKKPRGEKVKIEKENSHSSMESDSRSSNFVFMQGASSVNSNGKASGSRVMNYDGENSDDAHASEQQFSEEVQTGYEKDTIVESEDLSQEDLAADSAWNANEENNHCPPTDQDPLADSVRNLQSLQEALEKEVLKFGEIGKDARPLRDYSFQSSNAPADATFMEPAAVNETRSSAQSDEMRETDSTSLEMQVNNLKHAVKYLETKLEEARTTVDEKESRIAELEAALDNSKQLKEESESSTELQPEKCTSEMESEFECLFRQKIEAELEYLTLIRTTQKLKLALGDKATQATLIEEQQTLAEEQTKMSSKVTKLEKKAEELEKNCEGLSDTEVALTIPKRVCKVTSYFMIQLILLGLLFWLYVWQFSSHLEVIIPT